MGLINERDFFYRAIYSYRRQVEIGLKKATITKINWLWSQAEHPLFSVRSNVPVLKCDYVKMGKSFKVTATHHSKKLLPKRLVRNLGIKGEVKHELISTPTCYALCMCSMITSSSVQTALSDALWPNKYGRPWRPRFQAWHHIWLLRQWLAHCHCSGLSPVLALYALVVAEPL